MKKGITIVFMAILGITHLQAQVTFRPGIQVGLNLSNIQNTNLKIRSDYYAGIFGAIKLSKFYTLQPELTYTRQGAKGISTRVVSTTSNSSGIIYQETKQENVDVSLQYISSLVVNKFTVYKNGYILIGPAIDFVVGDEITTDGKVLSENISKGQDIDIAIVLGLGYKMDNGISFEGRFKRGNTDAISYNYSYISDGFNLTRKNIVFQLGISYTFNNK
jgi:hypothetical protein